MRHFSIHVRGKVQGVFFRASTKQKADDLGVKGFVRNEKDGSVYIEAEGTDDKLKNFTDWAKQGPPHAVVAEVVISESELKYFSRFEIQR